MWLGSEADHRSWLGTDTIMWLGSEADHRS
jgi:hypothetical protein